MSDIELVLALKGALLQAEMEKNIPLCILLEMVISRLEGDL